MRPSSPFGSQSRTRILLALSRLGSSYPRDLARRLDAPIFAIRKALESLQRDGLVTSRSVGRTRVFALDPSTAAYEELAAYLARLTTARETQSRLQLPEAPTASADPRLPEPGRQPALPRIAGAAGRRRLARDPNDGWRNW